MSILSTLIRGIRQHSCRPTAAVLPSVLGVIVTDGRFAREAYQALVQQNYPEWSFVISVARPTVQDPNPLVNTCKNCSSHRSRARSLVLRETRDFYLFVDSDVVMPLDAVSLLVQQRKDIIGGYCPTKDGSRYAAGRWVADNTFSNLTSITHGLTKVDMVGLGCAMVSRQALERLDFEPGLEAECRTPDGRTMVLGESAAFGNAAAECGFDLWMHGGVICDHL